MKRIYVFCSIILIYTATSFASSSDIYFISSAQIEILDTGIVILNDITDQKKQTFYKANRKENKINIENATKEDIINNLQNNKLQNTLFYVHGYGKQLLDVYERALLIQETYNITVVFFYWPFKTHDNKHSNLKQARHKINESMFAFNQFVQLANDLRSTNNYNNISFMAHSLGNYFLKLHSEVNTDNNLVFDNLILNSAAVNDKKHGNWLSKIEMQKRTYIIYNKKDVLLRGLQFFTRAKRQLGKKSKKHQISTAHYIDVSDIIGFRRPFSYTHSYFTGEILNQESSIKSIYATLFNGNELSENVQLAKNEAF